MNLTKSKTDFFPKDMPQIIRNTPPPQSNTVLLPLHTISTLLPKVLFISFGSLQSATFNTSKKGIH